MNKTSATRDFKAWARMGYMARGVVYLVVGGLALLTAIGAGGETTDSKGAIVQIVDMPFGKAALLLLIIGLLGYVMWRFMQAIKDTDGHGKSAKGLAIRGGLLASAFTHAALAFWAIKLLIDQRDDDSHKSESFLSSDTGQIVAGIIGVALIGAGIAHLFKGWTARFERYMQIPHNHDTWARPLCRFGLMARGVVWCIVGWLFLKSAMLAGSGDIKGVDDALKLLQESDYGKWWFGAVAAGLFSFGIYSVLEAIYRRIDIQSHS